jgi:ligand-binding sensor domain-containing protein
MGWATVQDADGVLHFGCNALVSFDGERWLTSPINGAYALRGLDFAKDGRLWAAAMGEIGWFDKTGDGSTWKYHSLVSKVPKEHADLGEVWQVFAEKDGAVFVSAEKLFRWDGKKMQVWPMPASTARRLRSMRVNGTIYVHHKATGLYIFGSDGPHLIIPAKLLGDGVISWMEPTQNGWLFATSKGLFTFDHDRLLPFAKEASDFVLHNSLTCAIRLPDGRLALGTVKGGIALVRADGTLEKLLDQTDGLPTNAIFSLFVDRGGKLWATSNSNIFSLSARPTSVVFDGRSALPSQPILRILRSAGRLTLATDDSVLEFLPDEKRFRPLAALAGHLTNLECSSDGLLIAGIGAVRKASGDHVSVIHSTLQDTFVAKSSRVWPDSILISEGRNIVLVGANGQTRLLVQNLPDIATTIAEDNFGRLWLGTTIRGTLVAKPDASAPVEAAQADPTTGLPAFAGQGLAVAAADGSLVVFSSTGGWIMGPSTNRFEPITGRSRGEITAASDIATDGTMWVAYLEGDNRPACVARISINGNHATWQPHSVEGLWTIGAPRSILAETSGTSGTVLWIGGTKGLLRHVVANGPVAPQPLAPLLHAFARSEGKESLEPIAQPLPYSTRSILFEFAAPEFALRPALRMETRIDGLDDRWIPADSSSRRELTAVRDGRYTFRVRTVAETGAISDETSFRFAILPPWWRTAPALAGLLLALLPVGYGAYRLRVRALRRHNAELERKVSQRTEQLEQASAAKTQFVANMSHDIRNPLNGIVGLALALEDTRLDPKQRELVATLRECTTYLSTLVDDVLDFASIEAGRVELRPGPFTAGELLRSVVTMLRTDTAVSGATLTVKTDPDLSLTLLGDAGRI